MTKILIVFWFTVSDKLTKLSKQISVHIYLYLQIRLLLPYHKPMKQNQSGICSKHFRHRKIVLMEGSQSLRHYIIGSSNGLHSNLLSVLWVPKGFRLIVAIIILSFWRQYSTYCFGFILVTKDLGSVTKPLI